MLCRVEMPANEQIYGRFYRYKLLRGAGGKGGGVFTLPLIVLALLAALLFMGLRPLLIGALAALAAGYLCYLLVLVPNRQFRARPGAALQTEVTILTETGLSRTVRSEEGGLPDNLSMPYAALHAAVETGRDFYLFTGPGQALLLDKACFTNGTPADLRKTLRAALGAKFKTKQTEVAA